MPQKLILAPILVRVAQAWAPKLFSWVLLPLNVRHCLGLSSYTISKKTYDPNSRKWQKNTFWPDLCPLASNLVDSPFFFKILALEVNRYHGQLSLCPISGKSNDPILRKVSYRRTNGWTDRWTDRQMDGNDFIERCRASSVQ